jgi:RNA-binding protein YlmH
VRSVEVRFEARPIDELQLPAERIERTLTTVEASLRLDAVGSAGFGLSRSRLVERIRRGDVRIDWQTVTSPSRELAPGQRVQLAGRGELLIEAAQPTQRGRWRVTLRRR